MCIKKSERCEATAFAAASARSVAYKDSCVLKLGDGSGRGQTRNWGKTHDDDSTLKLQGICKSKEREKREKKKQSGNGLVGRERLRNTRACFRRRREDPRVTRVGQSRGPRAPSDFVTGTPNFTNEKSFWTPSLQAQLKLAASEWFSNGRVARRVYLSTLLQRQKRVRENGSMWNVGSRASMYPVGLTGDESSRRYFFFFC